MHLKIQLHILTLLWCLCAMACLFVATDKYVDGLLLPKWHALTCVMTLSVLVLPYLLLLGGRIQWGELYRNICICTHLLLLLEMSLHLFGLTTISSELSGQPYGQFDRVTGLVSCSCFVFPMGVMTFHLFTFVQKAIILCGKLATLAIVLVCESRTGLLCIATTVAFALCSRGKIRKTAAFLGLASLLTFCYYFLKRESSVGRQFIFDRAVDMIKANPMTGWGQRGFQRCYMDVQANYFASNPSSPYQLYADNIHHPLNEYLLVAVNHGVPVLVLCIAVLAFVAYYHHCHKEPLTNEGFSVLLSIAVYSFFSYPFYYPFTALLLCLGMAMVFKPVSQRSGFRRFLLLSCLLANVVMANATVSFAKEVKSQMEWKRAFLQEDPKRALMKYHQLLSSRSDDTRFLYDFACVAYNAGDYQKALEISGEAASLTSDYQLSLLIADSHEALAEYGQAIDHYEHAHLMCPSRIVPHYEMYRIYSKMDDTLNCRRIYEMLENKPIKVNNYLTDAMLNEVRADVLRFGDNMRLCSENDMTK